jgi:outer membrane protein
MWRFPLLVFTLSAGACTYLSFAQSVSPSPVASGEHTAVITFNDAVLKTNEAQKSFADLQNKFAPREAQLKALNEEIDELKKQLNVAGDKLSDQERAARVQTAEMKEKQLQREAEDYRNDSQAESQQIFEGIAQKVYAFLQQYSRQHGYSLVIERGSTENPVVWYATSSADITGQLIEAYNSQAAVSAPVPQVPLRQKAR